MKNKAFVSLFLFALVSCNTKTVTIENNKTMEAIHKVCQDADVVNVQNKVESVEYDILCDGEPISLVFDKKDRLLYKESRFEPTEELLLKIQKKLEKNHNEWIIDEITRIETSDTSFIKVEVLKNGVEENLFFTETGKYYKMKNLTSGEPWTADCLKSNSFHQQQEYDVTNPSTIIEMPELLKEISGISVVDDSTVFCEQDELGVVFRLNLKDNSVSIVGRFTDLGDFEDVQTIQNNVYVLRSDGALLYFDYTAEEIHVQEKMLKIPCLNMEGLCYNKTDHYLYIACKDIPFEKYNTNFENRYVYKVNPSDYTVQPYLQVDQNEIRDFIDSHYNIDLSLKPILQPSALAFHPQSNFLYVLSADNRLIAVYDENDKLCNVLLLPPEEYYKPEGIDFMPNGDLLISSEGMKKGYLQGQVSVIKPKQND